MDTSVHEIDRMPLGLALMFGCLLLGMLVGAIVGRFRRFEWGAATALLSLAAGGLGGAAWVASFYHLETAVVSLARSGCINRPVSPGQRQRDWSADRFVLLTASGRELSLQTPDLPRRCDEAGRDEPRLLRYLKADAARPDAVVLSAHLETDPQLPIAGPAVLAAFGSFGLLAGLFFLAIGRRRGAPARETPVLSPLRQRLGSSFTLAGNFTIFGAAMFAGFAEMSAERSAALVFGAVPLACLLYALGMAARRSLALDNGLILVIVGAGCGAAAWSVSALS